MNTKSPYLIDAEFEALAPAAPQENDVALDADILLHGEVLKPLILCKIGKDILLGDGHRRHKSRERLIAAGHTIPEPPTKTMPFRARGEALQYILTHQDASRPNWGKWQRVKAIEANKTLCKYLSDEAAKREKAGTKANPVADLAQGGRVRSIKAKLANVSEGTYQAYTTVLENPELAASVDRGEITPGQASATLASVRRRKQEVDQVAISKKYLPKWETEKGAMNQIVCADVLDGLKNTPDNSIALIVTSPPYYISKERLNYNGRGFDGTYDDYLAWIAAILKECLRVLRSGGRICLNFDNTQASEDPGNLRYNCYCDFATILRSLGYHFRDDAIWYKQNNVGFRPQVGSRQKANSRIQRNWEFITIWQKGLTQLLPTSKDVNPKLMTVERNRFFTEITAGMWAISPVSRAVTGHPAAFPKEIPARCIEGLTYPGDVVLDIFSGSGTTSVAAVELGRQYLGIERDEKFWKSSLERIEGAKKEAARLTARSTKQIKADFRATRTSEIKAKISSHKSSLAYWTNLLKEQNGNAPVRRHRPKVIGGTYEGLKVVLADTKRIKKQLAAKHGGGGPAVSKLTGTAA